MIRQKYNNRYIKVRENRREWAIKGGQPRDLGDIWPHKTQEEDKQNRNYNRTQKTKNVSYTDPIKKQGMKPGTRIE